jgi:hypothetical protein
MKKITILKNDIIVQTAIFDNDQSMNDFIQMLASTSAWGNTEQSIHHLAIEAIPGNPAHDAIPAVFDSEGNEISPMIPAIAEVVACDGIPAFIEIIPAEYSIEISDCTTEIANQQEKAAALAYLNATDFKIIKSLELGIPVAEDVLSARSAARAKLQ